MKHPTIRIEGSILAADILEKIESGEIPGQRSEDFGVSGSLRDEISRAWTDANLLWSVFGNRRERLAHEQSGTTETRNLWMVPLLGILGYEPEIQHKGREIEDRVYPVSHQDRKRGFLLHILGFRDSLDKKREKGGPRISPHGMVQEYLNLTEHLYALVTNGLSIRLLRNSSKISRLSFLEFSLEQMMNEGHFADFALLFRLLHASRMPQTPEAGPESLLENYHQESITSGERIRNGLSKAVKEAIEYLANGFLQHPQNEALRNKVQNNAEKQKEFYHTLLRLVYRILFLMVVEERNLVFPPDADLMYTEIYHSAYSITRLRTISESFRSSADKNTDHWHALKLCFRLFQSGAGCLKIASLGSDLFWDQVGLEATEFYSSCLYNHILLNAIKKLSFFQNPQSQGHTRINYSAINVEEFGSVYEGMLEYSPCINADFRFSFEETGEERAATGSHYTPDDLVQPLLRHSLDHVISQALKTKDQERALLALKVCDIACGSGHILLSAARKIALVLATLRTGEEQPSPLAFRKAIRDVVIHCIYGVDISPLAVELCKVALWLEVHSPGEPLPLLDHHILCGNSIVGLCHRKELSESIPQEAFSLLPGDDKEIVRELQKRNKREIPKEEEAKEQEEQGINQKAFLFEPRAVLEKLHHAWKVYDFFGKMPESTAEEVQKKSNYYKEYQKYIEPLKLLADIRVGSFFMPKTEEKKDALITTKKYQECLKGDKIPAQATGCAQALANKERFLHYFLEFPHIFSQGGFDCILANPPFLGGQALSGTFGHAFLNWVKFAYKPAGACDLVVYFLRRIHTILQKKGFVGMIATKSLAEGVMREGGLDVILAEGSSLVFVERSRKWPGEAKLSVCLLSLCKGDFGKKRLLDNQEVDYISSRFRDSKDEGEPYTLLENKDSMFQGSIFLGDGFILKQEEAESMIAQDSKNKDVLFPLLNGENINQEPDQSPQRWIINFFDWTEDKAKEYTLPYQRVRELVKPVRDKVNRKPQREKWWIYERSRMDLYKKLSSLSRCFATSRVSKYMSFSSVPANIVFTDALYVLTQESFAYFSLLQSTLHEVWTRKYSSTLGGTLRYTPTTCFETFPFPEKQAWQALEKGVGQSYHDRRKAWMQSFRLGLTDFYNFFHSPTWDAKKLQEKSQKDQESCERGILEVQNLREIHRQNDQEVLHAYGWDDIALQHDFYSLDFLPENDRVRYTIAPQAGKELLKRLLCLNHKKASEEKEAIPEKNKKPKKPQNPQQAEFF